MSCVGLLVLLLTAPPALADECSKTDVAYPYAVTPAPQWVNTTSASLSAGARVCVRRLPGATEPYDINDPEDYDQADHAAEANALHAYWEWRQAGADAWSRTAEWAWQAAPAGYSVITGLAPDTEYEYRLVVRSDLYPERGWHPDAQPARFRTAALPSQPEPTLTPTSTPTPDPTPGPTPEPMPRPEENRDATDLMLVCSKKRVVLTDVRQQGRRVRLAGVADKRLVARRVALRYVRTGRTVARARVAADGSFSTRAKLPPKRDRGTNRARYVAAIGKEHSSALKLTRRLWLTKAWSRAGELTFAGRVSGRLAKPRRITVTRRVTCRRYEVVATFKLAANGRFQVNVPTPAGEGAAVYRLTAKVRGSGHKPFATYTLPVAVNIAGASATTATSGRVAVARGSGEPGEAR